MAYVTPVAGDASTTTATAIDTNFKECAVGLYHYGADSGSANAIAVTLAPAITAYTAGMIITVKMAATCTGATTLDANSLGTKNVYKMINGTLYALSYGDLAIAGIYQFRYDGTQFQLMNVPTMPSPAFQAMGNHSGWASASSTTRPNQFCISPNGQYMYSAQVRGSSPNISVSIYRYTRDPRTGLYYYDGTSENIQQSGVDEIGSNSNDTDKTCGITCGDTYVWVSSIKYLNGDVVFYRFSQALTGQQVMTISGTAMTSGGFLCGNDSVLYLARDYSTLTTIAVYTISGTTATRGTDITVADQGQNRHAPYFDGTYIYYLDKANSNRIRKYDTAGTLQSTTSLQLFADSVTEGWGAGMGIKQNGELYLIWCRATSTAIVPHTYLSGVTKP